MFFRMHYVFLLSIRANTYSCNVIPLAQFTVPLHDD